MIANEIRFNARQNAIGTPGAKTRWILFCNLASIYHILILMRAASRITRHVTGTLSHQFSNKPRKRLLQLELTWAPPSKRNQWRGSSGRPKRSRCAGLLIWKYCSCIHPPAGQPPKSHGAACRDYENPWHRSTAPQGQLRSKFNFFPSLH